MFYEKVNETVEYIRKYIKEEPNIGIILGSGLGSLVDIMENKKIIPYNEIPNFPISQVEGHAGNLVFGKIGKQNIVAMQGRFHYYEGFEMKEVTYPIFVMKLLGVENLIITNACGGINTAFKPGDLMLLTDFINGVSVNPLIGTNDERFGTRFPDMSEPYNGELIKKAKATAASIGVEYQQGIYTFFQGPYYETAAEIAAYARLGSDAIGMSTVPETIAANYLGMKVLGIACVTNMATGIAERKHSHEEVVKVANESSEKLCSWLKELLTSW